jgi:hypothetical protein
MEKAPMTVYRSTSDASGIYHDGTALHGVPSKGAADCGNLAAHVANSKFLAAQTIYVPLPVTAVPVRAAPKAGTVDVLQRGAGRSR